MIKLGKTVTLIDASDFDKLVMDTYGRPYHFQQQGNMMGQDTIYEFSVPIEPEFDDYTGPTLTEWAATPQEEFSELDWTRHYYPEFEVIVADLHERGLIPAGDYALHVWW